MLDVWKEFNRFKIIEEQDFFQASNYNMDPERLKNALRLYNQAVIDLQMKSDDIAAIGLKKAISLHPGFLNAKVLLSLCYILRGQTEQAQELLREVVTSDDVIVLAHRYLEEIGQPKDNKKSKGFKEHVTPVASRPLFSIKGVKNVYLKALAIFIVGVLISSFFFIHSLNEIKKSTQDEILSLQNTIQNNQEKIEQYQLELEKANDTIESMKKQLDDKEIKDEYLENVKILLEVERLAESNQQEKAASLLLALKDFSFQGVENEKFQALYEKIIPSVVTATYNKGYSLYQAGKYSEALAAFEELFKYDIKNRQYQYALYYAGRCNQFMGDNARAVNYYNQLINLFPNGEYVWHAKNRINEIQQSQ
ncbi:MAG: tetratricopeptide repeat protein [Clostridiaceae bacterium]|nr:tetratricopeptide repeat protein [Clostridiaceae bacterium]